MKLGLIARMDNGGLGIETWEAYRHLKPHKTLIIDLSDLNHNQQYPERYIGNPGAVRFHEGFLDKQAAEWITDDVDTVLTYEIPYGFSLYTIAKKKGVKTICRINYEFFESMRQTLPLPDVIASPIDWHTKELKAKFGEKVKMLVTPVDRERLPFRKISTINTFVHIAGVNLYEDRNGTDLLLQALPLVKSDCKFIIYTQHELPIITDKRVEIRKMVDNYWDLYTKGDCLILPRRYGGQSLQLNEAMSVGMIPIMLDCEPMNKILNQMSLVPTTYVKSITTRGVKVLECFSTEPWILAKKIDEMAGLPRLAVEALNKYSDRYADSISWENIGDAINTL